MRGRGWAFVGLGVLLVVGVAAAAQPPGAPRVDGPRPIDVGTLWVIAERNRGGFGWTPRKYMVESLGDRTWQGRQVRAFAEGETISYVDPETGGLIARVRGTALLESFDPPLAWDWPIFVGRSWTTTFRHVDHERGKTFDEVRASYKVEAYEEVSVPVGTFKAFRIVSETPGTTVISWWSPDIGLTVRSRIDRTAENYLGPGVRESEMIAYETRWTRPQDAE